MAKVGIKNDDSFVSIKRTPELEQFIVEQVFIHLSLGNMIKERLPKELYEGQEPKGLLPIELFKNIVEGIVEIYDNQFGLAWAQNYPDLMKALKKRANEKMENGELEIV